MIPIALAMILAIFQIQQFEVASIKPTKLITGVRSGCHGIDSKIGPNDSAAGIPLGRCVVSSGRLSHMIGFAYGVTMDMLKGGPEWVARGDDRFDVEAKAEDPSTVTETGLKQMFQALLAERFKLKFRRETHEVQGFALVVAKNGPKMKVSTATDGSSTGELKKVAAPEPMKRSETDKGSQETAIAGAKSAVVGLSPDSATSHPITINARNWSMDQLALALRGFAGQTVVDETGLRERYDFNLSFEVGQSPAGPLQDQLGLRLEPRKVSVDYLIVESAEKPTNN